MAELKFSFKELAALDADLKGSQRAINVVIAKALQARLRGIHRRFRAQIPRSSGETRRTFFFTVKRDKQDRVGVRALLGFSNRRAVSKNAKIAANVLQHPGGAARRGAYLWIPIGANRIPGADAAITPSEFFNLGNTFIQTSKAGNRIAFTRDGDTIQPLFKLVRELRFAYPPIPFVQHLEVELPSILEEIPQTVSEVIAFKKTVLESGIGR